MISYFIAKNISSNSLKGVAVTERSDFIRLNSLSFSQYSMPMLNTVPEYGQWSLKATSLRMPKSSIRLSLARPLKLPVRAFETSIASPTSATSLY